jgi:hypothetical protein
MSMGKGDQFQKEQFSVLVALGDLSSDQYEVRVGIRCADCKKKLPCKCGEKN